MLAKLTLLPWLFLCTITLCAETTNSNQAPTQSPELPASMPSKDLDSFTGKVTKNRVRLRLQPSLEAPILKELQKDDLVVVSGITDDFYATLPPAHLKGYIFRTYVLDNVVEGNHVNVRLEPDTNAPIVCQLNSGDHVEGTVSPLNSKWLEISLPEHVRFFVAKEFVENIGDKTVYLELERRRKRLQESLSRLEQNMFDEMKKPFRDIQLAPLAAQLNQIISQNQDLPQQVERAHEILQKMQEAYLQRSIGLKNIIDMKDSKIAQAQNEQPAAPNTPTNTTEPKQESQKEQTAAASTPDFKKQEASFVQMQLKQDPSLNEALYYMKELEKGQMLQGVIKPNVRLVKNVPGDFVLVDPKTQIPQAYLYSTHIDLAPLCGKKAAVYVSERPNNNFAFKAYFVLRVEQ